MLTRAEGGSEGFTLVEVIVSLVLLSVVVLGMAGSATRLVSTTTRAELRALAIQSAEDRITRIRLDPRWTRIDSIYGGTESDVLGIPGIDRVTTVEYVAVTTPAPLEYRRVRVTLAGPGLGNDVVRYHLVSPP